MRVPHNPTTELQCMFQKTDDIWPLNKLRMNVYNTFICNNPTWKDQQVNQQLVDVFQQVKQQANCGLPIHIVEYF
jgi:hypothetical protein